MAALSRASLLPRLGVERLLMAVERHDPEQRAEDDGERADEKQNRGHAVTPDGKRLAKFAPWDVPRRRLDDRPARVRFHSQDPIGAAGLFRLASPIGIHCTGRNP
jgi:hypothetical protein